MELHNTAEDIVFQTIEEIFKQVEKDGNPDNICTCSQCKLDTACYVLNRTPPYYIVSNRGVERFQHVTVEKQQKIADIVSLIHEGIKRITHNQRPGNHDCQAVSTADTDKPAFNIPTIIGRLFDGENFVPMSGIKIQLLRNNELVKMKDNTWQNPYNLVPNTEGTYTFWPMYIPADAANEHKVFEFSIKIESDEFEPLNHSFKIPVISEIQTVNSFTLGRTFKLPDLYMFAPGEAEKNGYFD